MAKDHRSHRSLGLAAARAAALLCAGAALAAGAPAAADTPLGAGILTGEIELGGRGITGDWGSSEFREYRDVRPGMFGSGWLRLENESRRDYLSLGGYVVGPDDQHWEAFGGSLGRWGFDIGWDQFPHTLSSNARTIYRRDHNVYTLPPGLQQRLQTLGTGGGGVPRSNALGAALSGATDTPLEFQYLNGRAETWYRFTDEVEGRAGYSIQLRNGKKPWGFGFGSPGGSFADFAAPIDDKIHTLRTGLEWARKDWSLGLGYTGSFYDNDLQSLIVANPLRATDAGNGSSRGRGSVAPDNSANQWTLTGAANLPIGVPTRIQGTFAYGIRLQDEPFLPITINSAIAVPAGSTSRRSFDGRVDTYLGNLQLTSRLTEDLDLRLRYRIYDYDNNSADITTAEVVNDQGGLVGPDTSPNHEFMRQNASADLDYDVNRMLSVEGGYEWEHWDRDSHREVVNLDEHTGRLGLVVRAGDRMQIRPSVSSSIRRGSEYRALTAETGNIEPLRKYDEANRWRNELQLMTSIFPHETVEISLQAGAGFDDYLDSSFGLKSADDWNAGFDVAWRPIERIGLRTGYVYEDIRTRMRSSCILCAGSTFVFPQANWNSRWETEAHNVFGGMELQIVPKYLDLSIDYTFQRAEDQTWVTDFGGAVADYPQDENTLHVLATTLSFHVNEFLTFKGYYSFEKYNISDFRHDDLNPYMPLSNINTRTGAITPTTDVFLGNGWEDYQAHIFGLSAVYKF